MKCDRIDRRDFISKVALAFAGLSLLKPGETEAADDWRYAYFISDGSDSVVRPGQAIVVGQLRLSQVDRDLIELVDTLRQSIQADLGCKHCAILWDGGPEDVIGSCSPHWELWPEHLKAGLPFKLTINGLPRDLWIDFHEARATALTGGLTYRLDDYI